MRRTVLITGASRGIGRATAELLAEQGHRIIGVSRRRPVDSFPGEYYEADFGDGGQTAAVFEQVARAHAVDAVVNNAGLTTSRTVEEGDVRELEQILGVNLRTAMQAVQACLPHLRQSGRGRIVNLSSRAALGMPGRNAYSAAKSGVIGFTRTWALELGAYGINVNAVAPGPVETELYLRNNPMSPEQRAALLQRIPLKRLGRPEDIANCIEFLISDKSSFMTGQVLYVCGGLSIGAAPL